MERLSKYIDTLSVNYTDKKSNAEVSTPYQLRQEMIDTIPNEFWKTPQKIFECCCGKGGFLLSIISKFMIGLKNSIPNYELRYKTIVEECIYFCDINKENIMICRILLGCNKYKLNYHIGDTLKINILDQWGLDGFSAVIGNPPFNFPRHLGSGNTIWRYFTKDALNKWVKPNGYLLFVHPTGWRKPNSTRSKYFGLFNLMTYENQMLYLSIHGIKDGKVTFKCGTKYDWYLIKNKKKYKNTEINDENGNTLSIDMSKIEWLPNYNINNIIKLVSSNGEKLNVIFNSAYHERLACINDEKTDEFKYPLIHSTPKKGIRYKYSKYNDRGHFGIPKIIFGEAGLGHIIIDIDGKYGMTQGAIAIVINNIEDANNIRNALLTDKFNKLLRACSWGIFRIESQLFTHMKNDFWKDFLY
jgi:hypothetical protein